MFVTTLVFIFIIRLRFPSKVSIATIFSSFSLTGSDDSAEDPALAVAHGLVPLPHVLFQDSDGARPLEGRRAIGIIATPVAHQNTCLVAVVYLQQMR